MNIGSADSSPNGHSNGPKKLRFFSTQNFNIRPQMTRRDCLRRTGLLCLHSIRNFAGYRAARAASCGWSGEQFWIVVNNNFLDIGVLEWCKIFADSRAKHHWRKSVQEQEEFYGVMLNEIRLTDALFEQYIDEMKTYRDKFIAHLDERDVMHIPNLNAAIKSSQLLLAWLVEHENDCDAFPDLVEDPRELFRTMFQQCEMVYAK